MPGFNLPPGCSVNDLPGNTPFDEFADSFVANHLADEDLIAEFLKDNEAWTYFLEAKAEQAWNRGDK